MTSWVITIDKDHPQHWGIAKQHQFWDMTKHFPIQLGDHIYFWQAGDSMVAQCRATGSAFPIDSRTPTFCGAVRLGTRFPSPSAPGSRIRFRFTRGHVKFARQGDRLANQVCGVIDWHVFPDSNDPPPPLSEQSVSFSIPCAILLNLARPEGGIGL